MKLILMALLLTGCGRMDVSDSNHTVGGEATIRIVVGVDVTACEGLPPEDKLECVQSLIDLAKMLQEQSDDQSDSAGFPMIP